MTELRHAGSVVVSRPPEVLHDLVADVTRTGEWSPVCRACWWDEVVAADRGREFAFLVGGAAVR